MLFAPVPGRADRDREAALRAGSERQENGQAGRQGQGHRQPRAETGTVVRVQRERILPPVPAAAAEDRPVDVHAVPLRVFSQVGVSVFVRYFFRFWAWVCRPGVFYWFWGLPNMSAWLMRWLCPVNSMSRPWWTMRSMIEAASLSSAKIVPHSRGLDVRGGG